MISSTTGSEKCESRDGVVHLIHVGTDDMVADILTKPLSSGPFKRYVLNITTVMSTRWYAGEFCSTEDTDEYGSKGEGGVLVGSIPQYHTGV